jgi:hypothetical protein
MARTGNNSKGALLGLLLARFTWIWRRQRRSQVVIVGTLLGSLFGAATAHFDLERLLLVGSSTETLRIVITFGLTSVVIMPLLVKNRLAHSRQSPPLAGVESQ